MKIEMPQKVQYIVKTLHEHGHEAYAVGGCVRDSILGRIPGDWDITTSASPYEVKEIFHRTIDTGIQHGTVTVMLDKEGFEVTTYRLDGEYEDCRHPKQVEFTKSLEEDLKRRDFTINAMAYNDEDGMVDLFEGLEDIEKRRIRCVGKAQDRFEEDALRILRAIRFSAQINFDIEEETKKAISEKTKNLRNISAERIREELNKLFLSKYPQKLQIAYDTGITEVVLPEYDRRVACPVHYKDRVFDGGEFVLEGLKMVSIYGMTEQKTYMLPQKEVEWRFLSSKERLALSYAMILWNPNSTKEHSEQESQEAKKVMQRLKFDNDTIGMVTRLVKYSHVEMKATPVAMRRNMNVMGADLMDLWFLFQRMNATVLSLGEEDDQVLHLKKLYEIYCDVMKLKQCVSLKDLEINGKDLIGLGVTPGITIGTFLERLLLHVIEVPEDNNAQTLQKLAVTMIQGE